MINSDIAQSMLEEFVGCDSDNPGCPEHPAVWLFGIEHGVRWTTESLALQRTPQLAEDNYSIKTQLGYRPFNHSAFKLLAAMNGFPARDFRDFAEKHQPFVRGQKHGAQNTLYFKGNLYPYACRGVTDWTKETSTEVGLTKEEYLQWCREYRLPAIRGWVDKYQPKLFIGVGITCRNEFAQAVFGKEVCFEEKRFSVAGHTKVIYHFSEGIKKLAVVPHFSGSYGLNSYQSLQTAGEFLATL